MFNHDGEMVLQIRHGPRIKLRHWAKDWTMRWELARRFVEGIEKLARNIPRDRRRKTVRLIVIESGGCRITGGLVFTQRRSVVDARMPQGGGLGSRRRSVILPGSFSHFIMNFNMRKFEVTLHELLNMLREAESAIKNEKPVLYIGETKKKRKASNTLKKGKGKGRPGKTKVAKKDLTKDKGQWIMLSLRTGIR
ncbi:hypothetical protein B296_00034766 [Ensete ventricosum]|uniref:Uncharacterized protein n=1 Tax=Ensete ventricosum TaxID=4639 RepID=A0A426XAL1_ENSVE|nr:hypothetical protein B296_00034766 [Ensete ventricosum]